MLSVNTALDGLLKFAHPPTPLIRNNGLNAQPRFPRTGTATRSRAPLRRRVSALPTGRRHTLTCAYARPPAPPHAWPVSRPPSLCQPCAYIQTLDVIPGGGHFTRTTRTGGGVAGANIFII